VDVAENAVDHEVGRWSEDGREKDPVRIRIRPSTQTDKCQPRSSPIGESSIKAAKSQPARAGRSPLRTSARPPRLAKPQWSVTASEGLASAQLTIKGRKSILRRIIVVR
jgi:hypothetical protein